jgi:uncharacterized protein
MKSTKNLKTKARAEDIAGDFFAHMAERGLAATPAQIKKISEKITSTMSYSPKVGVFGKTGAGKSSLCNALFGQKIAKVSDVAACTRKPQEIFLNISKNSNGLVLLDVPGIGENRKRDAEYSALYESLIPELDVLLWVLKADDRAYGAEEDFYKELVLPHVRSTKIPVIFVLNQVDKISPVRDWDFENFRPGAKQQKNIEKKINAIKIKFKQSEAKICSVAADEAYGLTTLIEKIVRFLPAEKKYGIAREAHAKNVSPKALKDAERGLWDTVKHYAEKAVIKLIPYILEGAFNFISKRWLS